MPTFYLNDGTRVSLSYGAVALGTAYDIAQQASSPLMLLVNGARTNANNQPVITALLLITIWAFPALLWAPLGVFSYFVRLPFRVILWRLGFQSVGVRKGR
jgi:hypothetical protein